MKAVRMRHRYLSNGPTITASSKFVVTTPDIDTYIGNGVVNASNEMLNFTSMELTKATQEISWNTSDFCFVSLRAEVVTQLTAYFRQSMYISLLISRIRAFIETLRMAQLVKKFHLRNLTFHYRILKNSPPVRVPV
jgi:hypothetical protein